jgi:hypothetical protein
MCASIIQAQDFKIAPKTSGPGGSNFYNVSIASDPENGFLVTWINTYVTGSTVYFRNYACRISKTGAMLDSTAVYLGESYWPYYCPTAVFSGGNWIISFNQGGLYEYVGVLRLTPSGEVLDTSAVNICNSTALATLKYPVLATNGQRLLCVMGAAGEGLYGSIFDSDLKIVVDRFLILTQMTTQSLPRIAVNGGNFLITFVNYEQVNNQYVHNIKLAVISPDGQILSVQNVNTSGYDNRGYWGVPTITTLNATTYVTYFHTPKLYIRRYSSNGQPIDAAPVKLYESPEFELVLKGFSNRVLHHYFDVAWANGFFHFYWPRLTDHRILTFSFTPDLSTINPPVSLSAQCQIAFDFGQYERSYSIIRNSSLGDTLLAAWIDRRGTDSTRVYGCLVDANTYTAVDRDPGLSKMPEQFSIAQNYPNPFNPSTTIRYGLPNRSHVTLTVFNTLGQQVATLVQGDQEAGYHEVRFDASGLSSGVYFYRLQAGTYVETRKLLLLR